MKNKVVLGLLALSFFGTITPHPDWADELGFNKPAPAGLNVNQISMAQIYNREQMMINRLRDVLNILNQAVSKMHDSVHDRKPVELTSEQISKLRDEVADAFSQANKASTHLNAWYKALPTM